MLMELRGIFQIGVRWAPRFDGYAASFSLTPIHEELALENDSLVDYHLVPHAFLLTTPCKLEAFLPSLKNTDIGVSPRLEGAECYTIVKHLGRPPSDHFNHLVTTNPWSHTLRH